MLGEDTDDTRSHRLSGVQFLAGSSGIRQSSFGRLSRGKPLEGAGSLSMQLVGCTPW